MKKNKFSQYLIFISLLTFVTVFILIIQSSYAKLIGPIKKAQTSDLTKPIDPNLDLEVLNEIEKREKLIEENSQIVSTISSEIPNL